MMPTDAPGHADYLLGLTNADGADTLVPVPAINKLSEQLYLAVQSKQSRNALVWPCSVASIPLAHALANAAAWESGIKPGFRAILYPAKVNFLQALDQCFFRREDVLRLASKLVEPSDGSANSYVVEPFREKDAFWFALHSVEADEPIHPSLAEFVPHYFARPEFQEWYPCDGELLRAVKGKLRNPKHKRALAKLTLPMLGNPDNAPDAIFAISWRASKADIEKALTPFKEWRMPDVILLDSTRRIKRADRQWAAKQARFIDTCLKHLGPEVPFVLVTDDPLTKGQLSRELTKQSQKKMSALDEKRVTSMFPVYGILSTDYPNSFRSPDKASTRNPARRAIECVVTDSEAWEIVTQLEKLKVHAKSPEHVETIERCAAFLGKLAALPTSTSVLVAWLNETNREKRVRIGFSWPEHRAGLQEIQSDPEFEERTKLAQLITRADEAWQHYHAGTPMARKMADLIEFFTRSRQKCTVAFTQPTARFLAGRYLETYDGYPAEAGFEVISDDVQLVFSKELAAHLAGYATDNLLLVGIDDETLRVLILEDVLPERTVVLLTRRNAAFLRASLSVIRQMENFASLFQRIDSLLSGLPESEPVHNTRSNINDFSLPRFSFEAGLVSEVSDHDDADPASLTLTLDNGMVIRRNPAAKVYIYESAHAHLPTRGFRCVPVSELAEGSRIFVMSIELRAQLEAALERAGIQVNNDSRFESDLRTYHSRIAELREVVDGDTLNEKAKKIRERISELLPEGATLPVLATVRNWLDVERFKDVPFDEARPGAPQQEGHFSAFAAALGIDQFQAVFFWKAVIMPLRGVRRMDGRRITDVYTELLLEPESTVVHRQLSAEHVKVLHDAALENVHLVEGIMVPNGGVR